MIQTLRSVVHVEKELENVTPKWSYTPKLTVMFTFLIASSSLFVFQSAIYYETSSEVSEVPRVKELQNPGDIVHSYHSVIVAFRAVDKIYGLQIMTYFLLASIISLLSLQFTFTYCSEISTLLVIQVLRICLFSVHMLLVIQTCTASINEVLY